MRACQFLFSIKCVAVTTAAFTFTGKDRIKSAQVTTTTTPSRPCSTTFSFALQESVRVGNNGSNDIVPFSSLKRRDVLVSSVLSGILWIDTPPRTAQAQEMPRESALSAGRRQCKTTSDPSKTTVTCLGDLRQFNADGRLSSISATTNGISTSAIKNPERYRLPWTYVPQTSDPNVAWESLVQTIKDDPTLEIVELNKDDYYLHATSPTQYPPGFSSEQAAGLDDLEFLLRPDDNLVLYRSASRSSLFVYPITQPVSDRDTNLKRLDKIRNALGWGELG